MSHAVRLLRPAQRDLVEIDRFLAIESPELADRILERMRLALVSLETTPHRGARPREARLRQAGYRFLVEAPSLVFYKVVGAQVRIHRVLHGRRSYQHLL